MSGTMPMKRPPLGRMEFFGSDRHLMESVVVIIGVGLCALLSYA